MGGGGGGPVGMGGQNLIGFGNSKNEIKLIPDTAVNFDDVAGCDGAKIELEEVVYFMKQPVLYM